MPCNAIAFQRASLTISENGQLSEKAAMIMTMEAATKLLAAALQKSGLIQLLGSNVQRTMTNTAFFTSSRYQVTYRKDGTLSVQVYTGDTASAEALAKTVKDTCLEMLTAGAGALLQAKLAAVIKSKVQVEDVQKVANGSIVMRVNL